MFNKEELIVSTHRFSNEQKKAIKAFNEAAMKLKSLNVAILHDKDTDALRFANVGELKKNNCQFHCTDYAYPNTSRLIARTTTDALPQSDVDVTENISYNVIEIITD